MKDSKEPETDLDPQPPGSTLAQSIGIAVHVVSGEHQGTSKRVGSRLTIGSAEDNDLPLYDKTISRHHCELVRTPAGVMVRDLGSRNGTRVGGARVTEALLLPGTVVRLGQVELVLRPKSETPKLHPSENSFFGEAIGQSLAMRQIFGVLEYMARSDATVLLEGETGTGKDVLARSIAQKSKRAQGPFVVVDCGALNPQLIESELFGHERGAFTGAVTARQGAFAAAEKGTLFLDELGELPQDVQPKLLRVLESRQYKRVGGTKTMLADVRVVAATKRDLQKEVAAGRFREDLYFRVAVVPIHVPPLRERREDIPLLVTHLLSAMRGGADPARTPAAPIVSEEEMVALASHDWPGNVRELRNVLERARLLDDDGLRIGTLSLPALTLRPVPGSMQFDPAKSYAETRAELDAKWSAWLVARYGGDIAAAAHAGGLREAELRALLGGG